MKAMVINKICNIRNEPEPLSPMDVPVPEIKPDEMLIRVIACGVCHTELDEIEGRTPPPKFPIIPGHEIIGVVVETGAEIRKFKTGDRVGIAWIHSACGKCSFCLAGYENLCADFQATGRDANGGYAEYTVAKENYSYLIPDVFDHCEAAPLMCAGAVGYRALRLADAKDGDNIGLVGFGASAHLVLQMIQRRYPASKIFVFARNEKERSFAYSLGAFWSGDIYEIPPDRLHKAIDTTPVWNTAVHALKNLERGGRLIINAIRKESTDKSSLLDIDYAEHIWLEKEIKTVANITGRDVQGFLELAAEIPIKPEVQEYALHQANQAIVELKEGQIRGAKVLKVG